MANYANENLNAAGLIPQPDENDVVGTIQRDESGRILYFIPHAHNPLIHVDNPIRNKSCLLAQFILQYFTSPNRQEPQGDVEKVLLKCVVDLLRTNRHSFNGMMTRAVFCTTKGYAAFKILADELFQSNPRVVTWSRIVMLYAFSARLALHCVEHEYFDYLNILGSFVCLYMKDVGEPCIQATGGWDRIIDAFPKSEEEQLESSMWGVLSWAAVGLSVATAALMLSKK